MKFNADVIIIGAGFAGVTAGRELSSKGHDVLILEARGRLGGRTWYRDSVLGRPLEMGGTWVHWTQPHVWAEIVRYGLALVASPVPVQALWAESGQVRHMAPQALFGELDAGLSLMDTQARALFPNPHDIDVNTQVTPALEARSVGQAIAELGLPAQQQRMLQSMMALNFNGDPAQGAYTQYLRWSALCGGHWELLFEACATHKLAGGTGNLIESIQADSRARVQLNSVVEQVLEKADGVQVRTADGQRLNARQVIIAAPLNTLGSIAFSPALSPGLMQVSQQRHAAQGIKVWIKVKGHVDTLAAMANHDAPLNFMQVEYTCGDDTLLVAFGPRAQALDPSDRASVEQVVRQWLPQAEVLAVDAHDWSGDPFALGTWPMLRPGQWPIVDAAARTASAHARLHLCGSDFAQGWAGFIDGAIESGTRVGGRVARQLSLEAKHQGK